MKCVLGLGNPGTSYAGTRHNIGRHVVESLAAQERQTLSKKKSLNASVAVIPFQGTEILLACPETFMNLSGQAVAALVAHYPIDSRSELLIVVDDTALPFGKLRMRQQGTDGGHNGLKSVEQALGHNEYPRLRIGVNPPVGKPLEEYVLERFLPEEQALMNDVLKRSREACRLWVSEPVERAIEAVNSNKIL